MWGVGGNKKKKRRGGGGLKHIHNLGERVEGRGEGSATGRKKGVPTRKKRTANL